MERILEVRNDSDDEPIGIVISGGSLPEQPPRLWAYVWGQDEEREESADLAATA